MANIKFSDLQPRLSENALNAISNMGFVQATPVQAASIPLFLSHKDVLVEAVTGSGKTIAFSVPVMEMLSSKFNEKNKHDVGALIIAPTRELATQIFDVLSQLGKFYSSIKLCLFVGGVSLQENLSTFLNNGGHVIVGTPGRVVDIQGRCDYINFKNLEVLVLDEADTLLDMGFKESINQILSFLPKQRRTGLFSATQTKEVKELARAGMRNPVSVAVRVQVASVAPSKSKQLTQSTNEAQSTPSTLENQYIIAEYEDRPKILAKFISKHADQKIIVFCATCACVDYYSEAFYAITKSSKQNFLPLNHPIVGFHGKMVPKKRTAIYNKFVGWKAGVMFSTDVAARGIDIPDVHWIVQLAAPKDPAFFVHRIGRTARAGRQGGALLFLTEKEDAYVELLRGRGVPLVQQFSDYSSDVNATLASSDVSNASKDQPDILSIMKDMASHDRALLEKGTQAFISFLRAYQENLCPFIFQLNELSIGSVARSYALLRLPRIPETREGPNKRPIDFVGSGIDTSTIPYKQLEREQARQRRLLQERVDAQSNNTNKKAKNNGEKKEEEEQRASKIDSRQDNVEEETKRKRKKKQSYSQKLREEWDELAAEEAAFRKFKKGKLSKDSYDKCLLSETLPSAHDIRDGCLEQEDYEDDGSSSDSD